MRLRSFLIACLAAIASVVNAQVLETIIPLGGGVAGPLHLAIDSTRSEVYVSGRSGTGVLVLDGTTGERVASVPITPGSDWLYCDLCYCAAEGKVYRADGRLGSVTVIDCSTKDSRSVHTGGSPSAACYDPVRNRVYCVLRPPTIIKVLDCLTDSIVASIPIGVSSVCIAYNPRNDRIYCVGYDPPVTYVIDPADNSVVTTIPEGSDYASICFNPTDNKVYINDHSHGTATVVDGETHRIRTRLTVGPFPRDVCFSTAANKVYCADWWAGAIAVFDGGSDSLLARVTVGSRVGPLFYDPGLDRVYCGTGQGVAVIDCETDSLAAFVHTGAESFELVAVPSASVFSAHCYTNSVGVVDPVRCQLTARVRAGFAPSEIVLNPANRRLYCVSQADSGVAVVDVDAAVETTPVMFGADFLSIVYSASANKLYCTDCFHRDSIVIVDCFDESISAVIPTAHTWSVCSNPLRNKVYAADGRGSSIVSLDGDSDTTLSLIQTPRRPRNLLYVPRGDKLYVGCDATLAVVDCAHDSVVRRILTPEGAVPLCHDPVAGKVYSAGGRGSLMVFDADADSLLRVISLGRRRGLDATHLASFGDLYVAAVETTDYALLVVDCELDTIVRTHDYESYGAIQGLAATDCGVYVCAEDGYVRYYDGETRLGRGSTRVGSCASPIWDAPSRRLYVAMPDDAGIAVIRDTAVGIREGATPAYSVRAMRQSLLRRGGGLPAGCLGHLLDVTGRSAAALEPGENDISHLSPGVYFLVPKQTAGTPDAAPVRKVVVMR